MSEPSEEAKLLAQKRCMDWTPEIMALSITIIDFALKRERNRTREECEKIAKSYIPHHIAGTRSAMQVATEIGADIRATKEAEC